MMNTYDYYNCPYEPDTGIPPCGQRPECKDCIWLSIVDGSTPYVNREDSHFVTP